MLKIKRKHFMGLAAGAAVGATVAQAAVATHSVAEDDPQIAVTHVNLQRSGVEVPAYAAAPRNAGPQTPGVVVVMHVWGVDESIRDTVRRFAKAGFAAISPDLYAGEGAPSGDNTSDFKRFIPFAQALKAPQVDSDLRAAAAWLKEQHPHGKIGITGFCMGGGIALRQAIDNADVFSADAVWYGKVAGVDAASVRIPIEGNFGEKDTGIPADGVREFKAALRVPNDIVEYPQAGHAFFDHTRESYVESAAEDGWKRTIAFFTKYLTG